MTTVRTRITVTGTAEEIADLIASARASGRLAHINGPAPAGDLQRVDVWLNPAMGQPPTPPVTAGVPEVVEVTYHLDRHRIIRLTAGVVLACLAGYLLADVTGAITAVLVLVALTTIIGMVRDWDTCPTGDTGTPAGS